MSSGTCGRHQPPLLFHDTDLAPAKAERASLVAATEPSNAVKLKGNKAHSQNVSERSA